MIRFLIRRIVLGLITLWVIITLVFFLYYARPGVDPARELAGRAVTPALLANLNKQYGFDKPVIVQYWNYLGAPRALAFQPGDLEHGPPPGHHHHRSVRPHRHLARDGIGGPVDGARHQRRGARRAKTTKSLGPRSHGVRPHRGLDADLHPRVTAAICLLLPAHDPRDRDTSRNREAGLPSHTNPLEWAHDLILPWITLALITAATYSRLTRSSLLETLGEDYIRTARAKGLSERRVVYRHALRSSLTPIITQFGIDLATVMGGAIITETIFGLPGLGQRVVQAIGVEDLPVVIGIVLVASFFVVAANIVVDALYAVLDPRVRVS